MDSNINNRKQELIKNLKNSGIDKLPDDIDTLLSKLDEAGFLYLGIDLTGRKVKSVEEVSSRIKNYINTGNTQQDNSGLTNKQIVVKVQAVNYKQPDDGKPLTPYSALPKKQQILENGNAGMKGTAMPSKSEESQQDKQVKNTPAPAAGFEKLNLMENGRLETVMGRKVMNIEPTEPDIKHKDEKEGIGHTVNGSALSEQNSQNKEALNIQGNNGLADKLNKVQHPQQTVADPEVIEKEEKIEIAVAQPVTPLSNEEVTGHTASLWKYVPIPENEPEPHTEYDMKKVKLEQGTFIGARVRGKKHKHEGTNCDDWFEIDTAGDWILIAVSDGAGSKKYSRIGARESCKAALVHMKDKFMKLKDESPNIYSNIALPFSDEGFTKSCGVLASIVQNGVLAAFNAVEKVYEDRKGDEAFLKPLNRELSFKDFSGTMLVAAAIPVMVGDRKEYLVISCQIGDGMLASIDVNLPWDKALKLLGDADGGSFAGETDFLTSPQMKQINTLMARTKIGRRPISCLMVMSDGVADDYYPNDPQMLRLYLDLVLNGIIGNVSEHKVTVTNKNMEFIKKVPKPAAYPWVNDPKVMVSIQYANRVMTSTGLSLEELWGNKDIISVASLHTTGTPLSDSGKSEGLLKIWLDNYVERGSFDDRTLVLFHV